MQAEGLAIDRAIDERLTNVVLAACARFGPAVAIDDGATVTRYSDLADRIASWSARFAELDDHPRIGFLLPNSTAYIAACYGLVDAGGVPFLMDPQIPEADVLRIAEDVGLGYLLVPAKPFGGPVTLVDTFDGLALLRLPAPAVVRPIDARTALCRFTSGSSGMPKCLEFSHAAVLGAARTWSAANRLGPDDKSLCLASLFNGLAFNTSMTASFVSGATLLLYTGFTAPSPVLRLAARTGATRLIAFPAFYRLLAQSDAASLPLPPGLTRAYSAASQLPAEIRTALAEQRGLAIIDYYGIAETGPVTYEPDPAAAAGNGIALPGCALRLSDGTLEVSTPYGASRYLNQPGVLEARITPDGFYRTADHAELVDGRLTLRGRADTLIDVGGRKFDPDDVVRCLLAADGIDDAVVFGRAREGFGQEICAAVASAEALRPEDIRDRLEGRIERFKLPHRIVVVDKLPRNGAGKLALPAIQSLFEPREPPR